MVRRTDHDRPPMVPSEAPHSFAAEAPIRLIDEEDEIPF
jgi:hypothetical protein